MTQSMEETYYDPASTAGFVGSSAALARASSKTMKEAKKWLQNQETYTLHKPAQKTFLTRRTFVSGIARQWQADLVEMIPYASKNNGHKYLLTVIDCFSRYAWARPIKRKQGKDVADAFKSIFKESVPLRIQTDHGKEFYNSHVKELFQKKGVELFSTDSPKKASIVERFNRTLKTRMWRYFTFKQTRKWMDVLQKLVSAYNKSYHRSIGMAPAEVNKYNEMEVWRRLYPRRVVKKPRFKIGDLVRISKAKKIFDKGYLPNWTRELFTISDVNTKFVPTMYNIQDFNGEPIKGLFYEQELQKVEHKGDSFRVEKVIRTRGKGKHKQYFVKWLGYPSSMNSWVNELLRNPT